MLVVIEGKWGSDFFLTNGVLDSVFVTLILFCFVLFCFSVILFFFCRGHSGMPYRDIVYESST